MKEVLTNESLALDNAPQHFMHFISCKNKFQECKVFESRIERERP